MWIRLLHACLNPELPAYMQHLPHSMCVCVCVCVCVLTFFPSQEPHVATALACLPKPELPAYVQILPHSVCVCVCADYSSFTGATRGHCSCVSAQARAACLRAATAGWHSASRAPGGQATHIWHSLCRVSVGVGVGRFRGEDGL
jgi:hypothetical protein